MSPRPTSRSADLRRLGEEGYSLEILDGHLLVHDVPYVTAAREVTTGTLVSPLDLANDVTVAPRTHVAMFIGQHPCHADGRRMEEMAHAGGQSISANLRTDFSFSAKPVGASGYRDYHHKMTTYIAMISGPATLIDPAATAQTFRVLASSDGSSPFLYADTASTRVGLGAVTAKIAGASVAIIGLGGTGSHILDLLAKSPLREIHLFDDDRFLQHNAFRSPGPTAGSDLAGGPLKVELHARRWAAMRTGVIAHPERAGPEHLDLLAGMDMVFVCVDSGHSRRAVSEMLTEAGMSFIDVGLGVTLLGDRAELLGQLRVTTSTPVTRQGAAAHLPTGGTEVEDLYASNIQVAELNALNGVLAVMRWKRMLGFYTDTQGEYDAIYATDGNVIVNTGSC